MDTVADLKRRIAELEEELSEEAALREKLTDILTRTAIALKGPEPDNMMWSWHDLPELAEKAMRGGRDAV